MKDDIIIVASKYYPHITDVLIKDAKSILKKRNIKFNVDYVDGVFEIPAAIGFASKLFNSFIALGCVIRGETSHYDYVCKESARGLMDLSLRGMAIGYGILTVENLKQAEFRAITTKTRIGKGQEAAMACISQIENRQKYNHD